MSEAGHKPSATRGRIYMAVIAALALGIGYSVFSPSPPTSPATPAAPEISSACRTDLKCAANHYASAAYVPCKVALEDRAEKVAKYQYKFDDGLERPLLSGAIALKKDDTEVMYSGKAALFQNGFSAWERTPYFCKYNIKTDSAVEVGFISP